MKKIVPYIIIFMLLLSLGVTAWAEAGGTVTEEVNEDGYLVTTFTDEDGNVFTIEVLPDIEDGVVEPEPEPTVDPTAEPETVPAATDETKSATAEPETADPQAESKSMAVWPYIAIGIIVIAAAAAILLLKRKK